MAHDLGTSALKSSLVDSRGRIARSRTEAYPISQRLVGYAEQDPEDWWAAFCRNCRALTDGIHPDALAGVILTGQMMCCLPVGADGSILSPAMLWSDARAEREWRYLEERIGAEALYKTVGMRGSGNYSLPKMMWFKAHDPVGYSQTAVFLSPKDYINYRLTGLFVTDSENAAYMYCYDREKNSWSLPLLDAAGIAPGKLPEIVPSGTVFGAVDSSAAEKCGLRSGTPVIMGIGDGGAATLGSGVFEPGDAYTSLGTSSWVCAVTERTQKTPGYERGISTLGFFDRQRLSGTMQAGGYAFSWFSNTFFTEEIRAAESSGADIFALLNDMAGLSPPGANGCLFQPYLFGERSPLWDSGMRAAFLGMNARTTRGDLCRSVQEGVTMHLKWIFDRISSCEEMPEIHSMRIIGGGAKSALWQQIFADIYGVPVLTVKNPGQAAALGLAVIAGTALDFFPDYAIIHEIQPADKTILPDPERHAFYSQLQEIYLRSVQCTQEINHRLAALSST